MGYILDSNSSLERIIRLHHHRRSFNDSTKTKINSILYKLNYWTSKQSAEKEIQSRIDKAECYNEKTDGTDVF
jgi:hypothetical protein